MKRLLLIVCALLLSGGAFFYSGCEDGTVQENVTISGVAVGGLSYSEATSRVREKLKGELLPLTIHTPTGDYTPTLDTIDDVEILVRIARANGSLTAKYRREWVNMESDCEELCRRIARESVDARLNFTSDGFEYFAETKGIACDYEKLLQDATAALKGAGTEISLATQEIVPTVTEDALRQKTRLLSQFTTYFDEKNVPRVNNIKLSASRISGIVLSAGEEFSFNQTVGLRTAENGYENATVIQNGVFTDGIGGGVCQTSTTLFNAALLAGMKITESRNHSLSISYVPLSLDAMVSEYSDLKFVNPYSEPVYLLSEVEGEGITFRFYGLPSGYTYETESVLLEEIAPPAPQIIEGDREYTVREEKSGAKSEGYLLTYGADGALLSRELIRQDTYATVQGIYQILPE